jgi:uncharacterized protein YutE (UPF0331/DUF86 family)/predicted nucleotidyltransferase
MDVKNRVLNTKRIKALKAYFEKEPLIILAFLFGSYSKGFKMRESDFDTAVFLKEKGDDRIWFNITEIVEKEVDLVYLNEAPATLISNVIKTGIPLVIKDRRLYWEIYLKASLESEDFLNFVEDFWRIYRRSKSLIPEDRTRVLERLQFLDSELKEIDGFKNLTYKEYCDDKFKRRNIERWTENIINATIDIAKIILASEKKRMPKTYEEALFHFGNLAGLTDEESKRLSQFASLRNILAHEYLNILYDRIKKFIAKSPGIYKKILKFLERDLKLK